MQTKNTFEWTLLSVNELDAKPMKNDDSVIEAIP